MDKKITRVDGTTRYVKIDNTIYDTVPKDTTPTKVICECLFCGERFGGNAVGKCAIYCKNCRTKEAREKITEENNKINKKL
jgi:hypothetical protein